MERGAAAADAGGEVAAAVATAAGAGAHDDADDAPPPGPAASSASSPAAAAAWLEALNWDADTPLHTAARAGAGGCVRALLAAGADWAATNGVSGRGGWGGGAGGAGYCEVHEACGGDTILSHVSPWPPSQLLHGPTASLSRTRLSHLAALPHCRAQDGDGVLHVACRGGSEDVVAALLAAGADPGVTNGVSGGGAAGRLSVLEWVDASWGLG